MADDDGGIDEAVLDEQRMAGIARRERRCAELQRAGRTAEAARLSLEDAASIFASKAPAVKDRNAALVLKTVVACAGKEDQLAALVESVSPDEADALMKYAYKGLANPSLSGPLLRLHERLLDKAGLGCVVRSIVDRRQP